MEGIPKHILQLEYDEFPPDDDNAAVRLDGSVETTLCPLIPSTVKLITIDGFDGAGKSTLATSLGRTLKIPVVHLDEFLTKDLGIFFGALDLNTLGHRIDVDLHASGRVIVDGCLVSRVLSAVGIKSDFRIYVMRTTRFGLGESHETLQEFDVLCGDKDADVIIQEQTEQLKRFSGACGRSPQSEERELPGLKRELIQYHRKDWPHHYADLIVKIVHVLGRV